MKHFILAALVAFITVSPSVEANSGRSRLGDVVGPYPARGSVEEAQDLETLLKFQETRTAEECRLAALEFDPTLANLFGGEHKLLSSSQIAWLKVALYFPRRMAENKIVEVKAIYKRPRPYLTWPEVVPCIPKDSSTAYPSGHATLSRFYARLLSEIYPKKARAFMKRADEVARNRVRGGLHHPSDIAAGKKLGDYLAGKIVIGPVSTPLSELNQLRTDGVK